MRRRPVAAGGGGTQAPTAASNHHHVGSSAAPSIAAGSGKLLFTSEMTGAVDVCGAPLASRTSTYAMNSERSSVELEMGPGAAERSSPGPAVGGTTPYLNVNVPVAPGAAGTEMNAFGDTANGAMPADAGNATDVSGARSIVVVTAKAPETSVSDA